LPGSRVDAVPAAAWAAAPDASADVVVFDGVAGEPAGRSALYVAPPPGAGPCAGERDVRDATLVDWDDAHPVLVAADAGSIAAVPHARAFAPPPWATELVRATARGPAFTLLAAGEHDGRRIACLGAVLDDALGSSDALPLALLTLGTLGWL